MSNIGENKVINLFDNQKNEKKYEEVILKQFDLLRECSFALKHEIDKYEKMLTKAKDEIGQRRFSRTKKEFEVFLEKLIDYIEL